MQFENINDLLKRLRIEKGLTQVELSELSGIDQGTISRIEAENTERLKAIGKLLDALGYSVEVVTATEKLQGE